MCAGWLDYYQMDLNQMCWEDGDGVHPDQIFYFYLFFLSFLTFLLISHQIIEESSAGGFPWGWLDLNGRTRQQPGLLSQRSCLIPGLAHIKKK